MSTDLRIKKRVLLGFFAFFWVLSGTLLAWKYDFFPFEKKESVSPEPRAEAFRRAEAQGKKGVVFLLESERCEDCKEAQTKLETLQESGWEFIRIPPQTVDWENLLADDRFAEIKPGLDAGRPVWGAWNLGEEILYLGEGLPDRMTLDRIRDWGKSKDTQSAP
ncbi:hypothetical protein [Leptospira wolffii]|uniref:hypothetical protein n=1 Tax=Leptospira wolffii TaxID=409998 RepID=UPI0002F0A428|nr:hypothetical protein [Leptospira wolffii]EPG65851.1 hypothetical protein LEP1GSC061_2141 [Leptospira wolffii serovar Khorat str. Khorat-H2]